jgi:hypothetical protein
MAGMMKDKMKKKKAPGMKGGKSAKVVDKKKKVNLRGGKMPKKNLRAGGASKARKDNGFGNGGPIMFQDYVKKMFGGGKTK